MAGYALTIDGFPYVLTSGGVASLPTSTDADWSTAWTLASGWFDWGRSGLRFGETCTPLDAGCEVDGLTFVVHDAAPATGPYAGKNLITYAATRDPAQIPSVVLAASIATATATTFTVNSGAALAPDLPGPVWIEGECLNCASVSGNTVTVTKRGYYGSQALPHLVDADRALYPEVWTAIPWFTRKRVIFWLVDDAGVATPLWRGYGGRAPRLHRDGAAYEIQADHTLARDLARPLGNPYAGCTLIGYHNWGVQFATRVNGSSYFSTRDAAHATDWYATVEALLTENARRITAYNAGFPNAQCTWSRWNNGLQVVFTIDGASQVDLSVSVGAQTASGTTSSGGTTRSVTVRIESIPSAVAVSPVSGDPVAFHVDRVTDLPATWSGPPTLDAGFYTTVEPQLLGDYDDDSWVRLEARSMTTTGLPTVTGYLRFYSKATGQLRAGAGDGLGYAIVDRALRLRVIAHVRTDHWYYGVYRALGDAATVRSTIDLRNWDFTSTAAAVTGATASRFAARDWYLDGSQSVGDFIASNALLSGCGLAVRASRATIIAYGPPTATDVAVGTVTRDDLVGNPSETPLPDGVVSGFVLKGTTDADAVYYTDARALGRYEGPSRTLEVTIQAGPQERQLLDSARAVAMGPIARSVGLWSDQLRMVTLPLNLSWLTKAYCGDWIEIDEWMLPDGKGGRGINTAANAQRAMVIGRDVDILEGTVTLRALIFPLVTGYAPAVRCLNAGTNSITAATGYIDGASDYAGSDYAGLNDYGVSKFKAGDKVRLIRRKSTSYTVSAVLTVQSVNTTTKTVTFTGAIPTSPDNWPSLISAGTWTVDLIPADYATSGASQRQYAYVGSASAGVIESTTAVNQKWSA